MTDTTCSQSYAHYAHQVEQDGQTIGALVARWHERWLSRRHLANLDADALNDIGLSPADARREANKPFWQA